MKKYINNKRKLTGSINAEDAAALPKLLIWENLGSDLGEFGHFSRNLAQHWAVADILHPKLLCASTAVQVAIII